MLLFGLTMAKFMIFCLLSMSLCLFVPTSSEKQLKLEDIEKDNLKSAQQSKIEKQFQQIQQYQQSPVHYDQQAYTQQGLTYPSAYSQYLVPQQYAQQQQHQQFHSGYTPLASNSLSAAYPGTSSIQPFQSYYTPQIAAAVQNLQSGQHVASPTQPQPIIMTIPAASISGLQQQAFYQVIPKTLANLGGIQYVPAQTGQTARYFYQPQITQQAATPTAGLIYTAPQQYISSFQPLTNNKVGASYQQQYLSLSPQTFSTAYAGSDSDYSAPYQSQGTAFSSSSVHQQAEQPTFVSVKAPQHLVASPGQQQQYLQTQTQSTTVSPFKYLNSPQYLAQNYNTIQANHLLQKNSFSSGIKSTVTPPVKITGNTGYITSSSNSNGNSNSAVSYQTYRGIAG